MLVGDDCTENGLSQGQNLSLTALCVLRSTRARSNSFLVGIDLPVWGCGCFCERTCVCVCVCVRERENMKGFVFTVQVYGVQCRV